MSDKALGKKMIVYFERLKIKAKENREYWKPLLLLQSKIAKERIKVWEGQITQLESAIKRLKRE